MIVKSRLQISVDDDVKGRVIIIGEKAALKELGRALLTAADSPAGFDATHLYKGNGHDFEIFITKNVSEEEWQEIPNDLNNIDFIYEYDRLKKSLQKSNL